MVAKQTTKRSQTTVEEEIRRRAYELYKARGCQDGHALDDWLLAGVEVRGTIPNATQPTVGPSPPKTRKKSITKGK